MTNIEHECRQGVLAFGDSITNGGGELQWGVALQSWVQWVARGLGLPFTNYAVDGALAGDVVARQLPAHTRINQLADARYQLGCLYIGVNDVRGLGWNRDAFQRDLETATEYLRSRCDRVLSVTIPLDLGRPRAGAKVGEANDIIRCVAGRRGALLLDLSGFGGRGVLMPDHVHPTALGQVEIAERAIDVLTVAGMSAAARPRDLVSYSAPWLERARYHVRYTRRYAWEQLFSRSGR